jgi:predicted nucleotidyltransferase
MFARHSKILYNNHRNILWIQLKSCKKMAFLSIMIKKYFITELSIFGSSIRDDFNINSDIDILVSFNDSSEIDLFDVMDLEKVFSHFIKKRG